MIVSINQPAYLPWLGYFHRIAASGLHVVLDDVQFEKNSFTNRNKVLSASGPVWLSVPVKTGGRFGHLRINDLEIDNSRDWRKKHWKTICQCYERALYFQEHKGFFESVYGREWNLLLDLCREITGYILNVLAIDTPLVYSSAMNSEARKDELVLDLCLKTGASTYLSGPLGRDYLREEIFTDRSIKVIYHDYRHPEYPQMGGRKFEPYLSILDLLFNCGPESYDYLTRGQEIYSRPVGFDGKGLPGTAAADRGNGA